MTAKIYEYEGEDLVVTYDLARCIHAEECVKGLPAVFDPTRRPWIDPSQATGEAVAEAIRQCPTGALQYRAKPRGTEEERPAPENRAKIVPDGPLYLVGELRLALTEGDTIIETRLALCRCGESSNKPFCDGSHRKAEFRDSGAGTAPKLAGGNAPDSREPLRLVPLTNGPIRFEGSVTIEDVGGVTHTVSKGTLCRCGHSTKKPFCDRSHLTVGFVAP